MTTTIPPPSYTAATSSTATHQSSMPIPINNTGPSSYQKLPVPATTDEKRSNVELVTRNMSTNTSCAETTCSSKLPMAYSSGQQLRKRSCGGCCSKSPTESLTAPQVLSMSLALLNDALSDADMQKPTSKAVAKANINALKLMLREVKQLRRGCHLSCSEKKRVKREVGPVEEDIRGVLRDLKREKCRMC